MFSEDINDLVEREKIPNTKLVLKDFITNKMKVEFNLLCLSMKYGIGSKMCNTLVVTPQKEKDITR